MSASKLTPFQRKIADCLEVKNGELVQRRDYLNLAGLDLTDGDLASSFDVPERGMEGISLTSLPHLRYLDLTGNQLTRLPACVPSFTRLIWLGLNFNRIEALPESLGALTDLQRLYLRGNALTQLPDSIGDLRSLVELDLTGCPLDKLPASMGRLDALEHVGIEERALAPDLRAAWNENGWKTLRELLMRMSAEAKAVPTQFVGKVVLVGAQENGKTCLQRALRGEPFQEGLASTDGMSRERLHLGLDGAFVSLEQRAETPGPRAEVIDLTLWDMGGQEHYLHTHQMFFTPSAVYLAVTMPRRGAGVQEIDKWIELVKRRTGGEATVIVVSTRCNEKDSEPDKSLKLEDLQARHGEVVRALVAVDSKDGTGIPELRRLLAEVVQEERTKCRHRWLPGWATVLNELSNSQEAFLRWKQIGEICGKHGIPELSQQRQVIRTGHYIGALLWREDIPAGEDVVILNPDWLCRAVARLLDDVTTRLAHGLVDTNKLERVWRGPGRDGTPGYEPDTYEALIELMEINELAYRPRVPGRKVGEGHLLLVTQMVEEMPKPDLETKWRQISPSGGAETVRVIAFRKVGSLSYEKVPDLIYLLIFRLRDFSLGRADFREARHWQRGLLVMDDYGSAGRIELEEERLRITVRHELEPGLMHSIVHRIGVRDDGFWNGRGLEKVEFVPCGQICREPGTHSGGGLISMDGCLKAKQAGNTSVECQTCHEFVPIQDLLSQRAVESDEFLQLRKWLEPRLRGLEAGQADHADKLDVIRKQGEEIQQHLTNLDRLVRMRADGILDAFTSEWKDGPRLFSFIPVAPSTGEPWWRRAVEEWTQMTFQITVWCEASRRPVPLFRELRDEKDRKRGFKGSETITLTRDCVQGLRKSLLWSSWVALALVAGGVPGLGALVTVTGGVISAKEANAFAAELARQQRALSEFAKAIPDDLAHPLRKRGDALGDEEEDFSKLWLRNFGVPEESDLKLIRYLREEFKKKDPTWGGLVARKDDKFGRIWAHPKSTRTDP